MTGCTSTSTRGRCGSPFRRPVPPMVAVAAAVGPQRAAVGGRSRCRTPRCTHQRWRPSFFTRRRCSRPPRFGRSGTSPLRWPAKRRPPPPPTCGSWASSRTCCLPNASRTRRPRMGTCPSTTRRCCRAWWNACRPRARRRGRTSPAAARRRRWWSSFTAAAWSPTPAGGRPCGRSSTASTPCGGSGLRYLAPPPTRRRCCLRGRRQPRATPTTGAVVGGGWRRCGRWPRRGGGRVDGR